MLLYLVNHLRFNIANLVSKILKIADGATMAQWKILLRNINYAITTEYLALKLQPNVKTCGFFVEWIPSDETKITLGGTTDSEFGDDTEICTSTFGKSSTL
jgi:hypothetical protein